MSSGLVLAIVSLNVIACISESFPHFVDPRPHVINDCGQEVHHCMCRVVLQCSLISSVIASSYSTDLFMTNSLSGPERLHTVFLR